jgi:hypothetical protein
MNKNAFMAMIAFIGLCLTVGFTYHRSQYSLNIQVNIKDLPEDGIILVSPSDPAFDKEVASLVSENPSERKQFIDVAKPFCVFIKNTGTREIAGYRLKWELLKADGEIITDWSSASAPTLLSRDDRSSRRITMAGSLPISPGSTLFVSMESVMAKLLYSSKNSQANQIEETIKKRNSMMSQLSTINQEKIQSVAGVIVTVDCAYFEDGTFVGPDTGNLLSETQGYIDAERELALMARQHIQERKRLDELFDKLKSIADESDALPGSRPSASDYKHLHLKIHARSLLKIRDKGGDDVAIEYTQQPLNKTWAKLQKKAKRD